MLAAKWREKFGFTRRLLISARTLAADTTVFLTTPRRIAYVLVMSRLLVLPTAFITLELGRLLD